MSILPYCKIGTSIITSYLTYDGRRQRGGEIKSKKSLAPGQDRSWISHQGREPKSYDMSLAFSPGDEDTNDDVMAAFNNAVSGDEFYPYDAARFHRLALSWATQDDPVHSEGFLRQIMKARVECELSCLFSASPTSWSPGWEGLAVTDGMGRFTSVHTGFMIDNDVNLVGNPNRYIAIKYRYISGATTFFDIQYSTGGHGHSYSYYKHVAINQDGEWHTVIADMWNLTLGGDDWKNNTITAMLLAFWTGVGVVDVAYLRICKDAAGEEITQEILSGDWDSNADGTWVEGISNDGKIDAPLYGLSVQAVPAGAGQAEATAVWYAIDGDVALNGNPNRYILLRYRYVSGTFDNTGTGIEMEYKTAGHVYSFDYYKRVAINKDGEWHTVVFDMWDLDVGGDDWKNNAITGIELVFWSQSGDIADVEYVVIAEDAAGATINHYIFSDDWDSVNNGTLTDGEPDNLAYSLMDGATVDGVIDLAANLMSGELLEMDVLGQITRTYAFDPALVRGQEQFDTDFFWHAALVTDLAGANNDVAIIAVLLNSELPSLKLTDPGGNDQTLSVSVVGNDIDVSLATGAAGAITSTSTLVVAAINAKAEAAALVTAAVDGSDGTGVVTALAKTNVVGPDITSGKIAIAECESVIIKITGPWPLAQHARLTFTPDIGAGAGLYRVSISTDSGGSWLELYTNANLVDEDENVLWLSGTKGYVTAWVKIECDQDISMTLDDLETYVKRYVPEGDVPVIDVGNTRAVKIDDSNDTIAGVDAVYRNRWQG